MDDETARVNYEFGFDPPAFSGPIGKLIHKWVGTAPIHESILIAAFILIKDERLRMAEGTTAHNLSPEQWEFFRGLLWPDDPRCLIFVDSPDDNRKYGYGLDWLKDYVLGGSDTMTQRSHFGDLQFLHAMGSRVNEHPRETRDKMLQFIGVLYRLATGQDGVAEEDSVTKHFPPSVFGPTWNQTSLRALLLATTPSYAYADVRKRALGVCLHMIQDSYAIGHAKRELLNPEDMLGQRDEDGYVHFKPGTHGRWGDIMCFHTYNGQKLSRHKHYDGVPEGAREPSPGNLSTFDPIIGARSAIEGCLSLLQLYADNRPWDEVKDTLEKCIFRLHPNAQPSDVEVDMVSSEVFDEKSGTVHDLDVEYWAGHERKLRELDTPGTGLQRLRRSSDTIGWSRRAVSLGFVSVLTLACIFTWFTMMARTSDVI